MVVLEQGWRIAYLPGLRLVHVIPAGRLTRAYLAAYAYSTSRTWVRVLDAPAPGPGPRSIRAVSSSERREPILLFAPGPVRRPTSDGGWLWAVRRPS